MRTEFATPSYLLHLFEYLSQATHDSTEVGDDWAAKSVKAEAFSSDLAPAQRTAVLERFKRQEVDVFVTLLPCSNCSLKRRHHRLICSDLISRGLDVPHVSHVISYDTPVDMRKYVHRVGRTARAGKDGDAWSLVEEQEVR